MVKILFMDMVTGSSKIYDAPNATYLRGKLRQLGLNLTSAQAEDAFQNGLEYSTGTSHYSVA